MITKSSSAAVLDPEVFAESCELLGPDRIRSLLIGLKEQLNQQLWSDHAICGDCKLIVEEAHKLASAAGMFGLIPLSDACARLEIAATNNQIELPSVLAETRETCHVALAEIGACLNKPPFRAEST